MGDAYGYPLDLKDAHDEIEAWRSGCAAAFGCWTTANPRATLIDIARSHEAHHQEHHTRESALRHEAIMGWESARTLAIACSARATEKAADEALARLRTEDP